MLQVSTCEPVKLLTFESAQACPVAHDVLASQLCNVVISCFICPQVLTISHCAAW